MRRLYTAEAKGSADKEWQTTPCPAAPKGYAEGYAQAWADAFCYDVRVVLVPAGEEPPRRRRGR
jgi:hypothetical protein